MSCRETIAFRLQFWLFFFFFPRSSPDLTLPAMTRGVKKDKADKAMPTYLVDSWGGSCGFTSDGIPGLGSCLRLG